MVIFIKSMFYSLLWTKTMFALNESCIDDRNKFTQVPALGKNSADYTNKHILSINMNTIYHALDGQHLLQMLKISEFGGHFKILYYS